MPIDPLRFKSENDELHFPMPVRATKTPQGPFGGFCFSQRNSILEKIKEDEGLNALS